jgi:hypothetical protein
MIRDKEHLKFVADRPCFVCETSHDVQAHHLMRTGERGIGLKSGDDKAIPLCFTHHTELHLNGDEVDFFELHGIDHGEVVWYAKTLYETSKDT